MATNNLPTLLAIAEDTSAHIARLETYVNDLKAQLAAARAGTDLPTEVAAQVQAVSNVLSANRVAILTLLVPPPA